MSRAAALDRALERAAHVLPAQNPLENFVHHNTLHAFEGLPFREAVEHAADLTGARSWCPSAFYRDAYDEGRILARDLDAVIEREVADAVLSLPGLELSGRRATRLLMLAPETGLHQPEASAWSLHERHYIEELPPGLDRESEERLRCGGPTPRLLRELWRACDAIAEPVAAPVSARRLALHVSAHLGRDLDALVEPALLRWATAYLDLGQASWPMPQRDRGFFVSALAILDSHSTRLLPGGAWLRAEARRLRREGTDSVAAVLGSLEAIGVSEVSLEAFLLDTLLALPGLGGMFERLASRPDLAPGANVPAARLVDLLAVRLLLERASTRHLLADLERGLDAGEPLLRRLEAFQSSPSDPHAEFRRVAPLFHAALTLGLLPHDIREASAGGLRALRSLVGRAFDRTLRWLWHLAYERRYRVEILDALVVHGRAPPPRPEPHTQVVCCIDDREESLRRHLEEVDAGYETYGYAGFYGVAVRFRALGDEEGRALCPASVTPTHALLELPVFDPQASRFEVPALPGAPGLGAGARIGLLRGAIEGLAGSAALLPMAWRLLFPEASASAHRWRARKPATRLTLLRDEHAPPVFGLPVGYSEDEMASIVGDALRTMGLHRRLAPLVVVLGHGSTSVNNPHAAGYNCGACSGGSGAPNARAFAAMCNRPGVRERLCADGLEIPDGVWFVGGVHDTASDDLELFDVELVPETHRASLEKLRRDLDLVARRDAHERCRRFESAPLGLEHDEALRHVVGRTEDLAQARPEYNHVTNALCVVGPRAITRGLFLDRRAFLVSYDATGDEDGRRLGALLDSVGPVGAGINLEYFFSFVDNERYGAGTKLPHNVVGLLAVMNGSASDLRTGLVEQMVEIHEPMRLLLVVEGEPEFVGRAAARHPGLQQLIANRWVLVATYDSEAAQAHFLEPDGFCLHETENPSLPTVERSQSWYAGHRGCLRPARVEPPAPGSSS